MCYNMKCCCTKHNFITQLSHLTLCADLQNGFRMVLHQTNESFFLYHVSMYTILSSEYLFTSHNAREQRYFCTFINVPGGPNIFENLKHLFLYDFLIIMSQSFFA